MVFPLFLHCISMISHEIIMTSTIFGWNHPPFFGLFPWRFPFSPWAMPGLPHGARLLPPLRKKRTRCAAAPLGCGAFAAWHGERNIGGLMVFNGGLMVFNGIYPPVIQHGWKIHYEHGWFSETPISSGFPSLPRLSAGRYTPRFTSPQTRLLKGS